MLVGGGDQKKNCKNFDCKRIIGIFKKKNVEEYFEASSTTSKGIKAGEEATECNGVFSFS
jgi:hypothetical protein